MAFAVELEDLQAGEGAGAGVGGPFLGVGFEEGFCLKEDRGAETLYDGVDRLAFGALEGDDL